MCEFFPQRLKFLEIVVHCTGVISDENIFPVGLFGAPSPVVAPRDHSFSVKDGELMMHMVLGEFVVYLDAVTFQPPNIRTQISSFIPIGDDSDCDASLKGCSNGFSKAIVCEGEHADIHALLGLANELNELIEAGRAGAKVHPGMVQ